MAKVTMDDKSLEIDDNSGIDIPCEKLGIVFGCYAGVCGSCKIEVIKGTDNLTELTEEEKEMDMTATKRLACQCRIKKGEIEIRPAE